MGRVIIGLLVTAMAIPLLARGKAAFYAAIVTFLVTFAFGLPVFLLLRRLRKLQWWWFALAGAGIGLLCVTPFTFMASEVDFKLLAMFAVSIGLCVAHAFLFWLVAVWRNSELGQPSVIDSASPGP